MTRVAVWRQRRHFTLLVVTGKASGVRQWSRLKRSLLQPESIADVFRRLRYKLIIRLFLWLISLMTIGTIRFGMLIVWKKHTEVGNKVSRFCR